MMQAPRQGNREHAAKAPHAHTCGPPASAVAHRRLLLVTTTCPPVYRCASLLAVTEVLLVLSDMTSCHLYIRKFMCGDFSEQTSACGSGDLSQSTSGAVGGAG